MNFYSFGTLHLLQIGFYQMAKCRGFKSCLITSQTKFCFIFLKYVEKSINLKYQIINKKTAAITLNNMVSFVIKACDLYKN